MFSFSEAVNQLIRNLPALVAAPLWGRSLKGGRKSLKRGRSHQLPAFDPVEERVLLSSTQLLPLQTHASAEVTRAQKALTTISGVSGNGLKGGTASLTATLSSQGTPLAGRTVVFLVRGRQVGRAITNEQGVAVLNNARLKNLGAGAYARGLVAKFAGDPFYKRQTVRGPLTVSRFATTLSDVSATGTFGGPVVLSAKLTSNSAPLFGRAIDFQFNGQRVGSAVTNNQGVAVFRAESLAGLNAGFYPGGVTARFVGGAQLQGNVAVGGLTVAPAPAWITIGGLTPTYDGAVKTVSVASGGLSFSLAYTDSNGLPVANPKNAGVYQVTATITDPNYVGTASEIFTIQQAQLNVSGITASGKVYDGSASADINASNATLVGVVAGDDVALNVAGASGSFANKNAGVDKTVTIAGLTLSGASAANYRLAPATTTATIAAATLTASGIAVNDKTYDGTTVASLDVSNAVIIGVIAGDQAALDSSAAVGAFADKNAGQAKPVTIADLALTGADAANYVVATINTTADINAATLTVTGITADKVYDGTTDASLDINSAVLSGLVAGDDVTLDISAAAGAFGDKNAGVGKAVTVSGLTIGGADVGNYVLAPVIVTGDITAATLTVSGITASDKVYDGTVDASIDVSGAVVSGLIGSDDVTLEASAATGAFADKNAGAGKVVTINGLILNGADAGNYVIGPVTTTAEIIAATITVAGITADKVYDGTTNATLDAANATLDGLVTGDDVTIDVSGITGSFADKNVGVDKAVTVNGLIALSGADAANYVLASANVTATGAITAASLQVSGIVAGDKVYDGTAEAAINVENATLIGLVLGDDAALDVSGAFGSFADKNVGVGKTVTINDLTLSGADAANYVIVPVATTATITAATLTVSGITANSKVYDGTIGVVLDSGSAVLVGVVAGEDVVLFIDEASGAFGDKNVGIGKTVTVSGLTIGGADVGNYVLAPVIVTGDITAATLTVSGITASDKVYDGTVDASIDVSGAVVSGLIGSDDVTLEASAATGAFADKNAGAGKVVVINGLILNGVDAANYIVVAVSSADVAKATLTVTGITALDKAFDGTTDATLDASNAALVGVVENDDVTLDFANVVGQFETSDPGQGKTVLILGLALVGDDAENYDLIPPTTIADITA